MGGVAKANIKSSDFGSDSSEEESSAAVKKLGNSKLNIEPNESSSGESETESDSEEEGPRLAKNVAVTKPKSLNDKEMSKLTPEERKKLKNKLKRKKQQAKKVAMKRKSNVDEDELGQVGKKAKKFYDPESNHNKRSAAQ